MEVAQLTKGTFQKPSSLLAFFVVGLLAQEYSDLVEFWVLTDPVEDLDEFKTILKPRLKLIVQNDEREWCIVFVSKAHPNNDQATKMAKKVYARLEVDFSSKKRERCCKLDIHSPEANFWEDLESKIMESIRNTLDRRVQFYEDEIRKLSEQRLMPIWNFCNFFILKESLAFMFEMAHLHEDSLREYDELELCYLENSSRLLFPGASISGPMLFFPPLVPHSFTTCQEVKECRKNGENNSITLSHMLSLSRFNVAGKQRDFGGIDRGILEGWVILADKLHSLGVVTLAEMRIRPDFVVSRIEKSCNVPSEKAKLFFVDAAKVKAKRVGEAIWFLLGGREEQLVCCLVGQWGEASDPILEIKQSKRVLKRGLQWFEKKCLHLERWEPKVVFFRKAMVGSSTMDFDNGFNEQKLWVCGYGGREEETLILTTSVKGLHMDHGGGVARGKNVVLDKGLVWGPLDPKHMRGLLEGFLAAVKSRFGDCYGLGELEGDAILDPLRVILLDGMAMGGSIGLELGVVEEGGGVLMERDLVSGLFRGSGRGFGLLVLELFGKV
ncbi:Trafficking protein particle complex II-specific subunit 130-like [Vitis vinifera]|uniref:Trafficking protein particle complex II-specific subunit 130-like n=1 Tax=Vitis vinifera TaxID=29760 RepID=A0A438DM15_VITVI|nr:Trafficking protein particle complex II-specific subunit 130-like [Vitis vinifera]